MPKKTNEQIDLKKIKQEKPIEELLKFSIINLDKPSGPTSFQVGQIIKKELNLPKTSHYGTLDPMVTGVLPIALGRACKLMQYFIGKDKTYVGIMKVHKEISLKEIQKISKEFLGKIIQLPPVRSRVKREERERTIHTFNILEKKGNDFLFESKVEAGTYIRKLIHDLGEKIGGAHMIELRRTQASIFNEKDSTTIYEFLESIEEFKKGNEKKLREILIPGEIISRVLPIYEVETKFIKKIYHGSPLQKEFFKDKNNLPTEETFAIFNNQKFIGTFKKITGNNLVGKGEYILQPIK